MKITDKMVGMAADCFEGCPNDYKFEEKIRAALEASLANVLEQLTEDRDSYRRLWQRDAARADVAEVKLAAIASILEDD